MSNPNPNVPTRFAPGNTLGGRPKGARARLGEKFQQALADDFEQHGDGVIRMVRSEDPTRYLEIVAKLQPREVEAKLSVEQAPPGNLEPEAWATLRRVLDLIQAYAPADAEPGAVFQLLEDALRAKTIEHVGTRRADDVELVEIPPPPC